MAAGEEFWEVRGWEGGAVERSAGGKEGEGRGEVGREEKGMKVSEAASSKRT